MARFLWLAVLLPLSYVVGCGGSPQAKITGHWTEEPLPVGLPFIKLYSGDPPKDQFFDEDENMKNFELIFKENGKVTVITAGRVRDGRYELEHDGKNLTVTSTSDDSVKQEFAVVSLTSTEMVLEWSTVAVATDAQKTKERVTFTKKSRFVKKSSD
jgi:hypothetical protein